MIGQTSAARSSQAVDFATVDRGLGMAQQYMLIAAVLIVPFAVFPDSQFLDFTGTAKGTMLALLGWPLLGLLAARVSLRLLGAGGDARSQVRAYVSGSRLSAAVIGLAALVAGWALVSAALSPLGTFPFMGRVPGTGGGAVGAVLYSTLALGTAWSVMEHRSSRPLVLAVIASTVLVALVGAAQYFGLAPFGISNTLASAGRVTGTAGNPVFFGALLVVGLPLVVTYSLRYRVDAKYEAIGLATVSVLFTLALVSTASRGPWLGAATGLVAAAVCMGWMFGARRTARWAVLIVAPAAVTAILMFGFGGSTSSDAGDEPGQATASSSLDRVTSSGSISRRLEYWSMAAELSVNRPDVPFAENRGWFSLFMFGYGPDSARYVLPLEAPAGLFGSSFTTVHNDPLNRLLEQGIVGFGLWAGLWGALGLGVLKIARDSRRSGANGRMLLAAGLAGALSARFVEQLTGVPMPGDQVISWVLVGVVAAACLNRPAEEAVGKSGLRLTVPRQLAFAGAASVVAVLAIAAAWNWGIEYAVASHEAAALQGEERVLFDDAEEQLLSATERAPAVLDYHYVLADLYRDAAANPASGRPQVDMLTLAYEQESAALAANPYEPESHFRVARSAWELGQLGVPGKAEEAVALYERMALLAPEHPLVAERLPALRNALAGAGQSD